MSTVGSPRPFAHRHFGFDNPHALGAGRLSPLSHDSLVAISCSLINFSSRASSRWVHMDVTFGSHLALSLSLSALPCALPPTPRPSPPRLGIDTLSRKYHFSIQTLLNIDHLGAWPASGPYLPSPAFPPAPQNLGIDTLSRKYHFSIQTLLNNDHLGAWLASGPYLPFPAPQNPGIGALSRKYHFSIQTLLGDDHLGAWLASGP